MTAFVGWQELVLVPAALALAGLLAGIALLIIGLVQRRRGLWIGGLTALIISILLLVSMAGFALLVFARVSRPAPAVTPRPPVTTSPASISGAWAEDAAGTAKPACR
jgi:hypothetical protein